jgi:glycosyltransferase involved in cell wall biosynthesis
MKTSVNRPKRLGIFLGIDSSAGGMFQYAQSMLQALSQLDKSNYQVVVAYSSNVWKPYLLNLALPSVRLNFSFFGIKIANFFMVIGLPGSFCRLIGGWVNPLVRELMKLKCDAWIFPSQDSLTWQVPGVISIGVIHDLMHRFEPHFPEVSSNFRYYIRENRFRSIAKHSSTVVVDSFIGKNQVVHSYGIDHKKVIPLPYVAPDYLTSNADSDQLENFKKSCSLPKKYLFYPAQFWAHKNHLKLLDAFKSASISCPDMQLVLSGSMRNEYKKIFNYAIKIGVIDGVHFVGYVPDSYLREMYLGARALIYPTFFGPTNIPPLEAHILGCPAALSDIYAMRERSKDGAIYFDPNNVSEIAEVMSTIWLDDDLCSRLSSRGLELSRAWGRDEFKNQVHEIVRASLGRASKINI